MTFEITFLGETDTALLARVRLLLGMDAFVPGQVVLHAESLAAHVTRVIFLTRVYRQVTQHLLFPPKSFGTIGTSIWELIRMDLAVYVERRFGLERLAASVAYVWTFTGMDTSMVFHGSLHGEAAATYITGVILHAVVHVFQVII